MEDQQAKAMTAEFLGTFALVFIGAGVGTMAIGGLVGVALAHGLVVVAWIYGYGHLSGAHINPAVTAALWCAKQIDRRRVVGYWLAQLLGGTAAALLLQFLIRETEWADNGLGRTALAPGVSNEQGLVLELVLTFFLVSSVLQAAIHGKAGRQAGLAIGAMLMACILVGAPISGASLNPARSLGPAVATGDFTNLWIYFVGPIAGGLLAVLVDRALRA